MKLNVKATALAAGLLWSLALFFAGAGNLMFPGYAEAFLNVTSSLYPGYTPGTASSVLIGALYGLADGVIGGGLFAWLYNRAQA